MKSILVCILLILFSGGIQSLQAQSEETDLPPAEYFDFWLGDWNLSWIDGQGGRGYGYNSIRYILNDHVISEHFEATSGELEGYKGQSYSVYNNSTGEWKQTWIDNQGGYLDFTGAFEDGKRMFVRSGVNPAGQSVMQRMVFYDINEEAFKWDWEVSADSGNTWQLRWRIFYTRQMPDH